MNMGLWAFDRYILKGHYAYISFESIKENFRHGFEWDNDHLNTNMFAHPYNGSLFLMREGLMDLTFGNPNYLLLVEVLCGSCLWSVNILLPMIS